MVALIPRILSDWYKENLAGAKPQAQAAALVALIPPELRHSKLILSVLVSKNPPEIPEDNLFHTKNIIVERLPPRMNLNFDTRIYFA